MTGTAAQRGASNRRRGHDTERALARWLRGNGWAHAERAVRTGFRTADRETADPGDITGTPSIVWSVKDCAAERIDAWLVDLSAMAAHDDGFEPPVQLLVHKRRGHADPGRWWCWLRLRELIEVLDNVGEGDGLEAPVRLELGHVVPLLHAAGYGDAQESGPLR